MNITKFELCSRVSKRFNRPASELKPIFDAFLEEILSVLSEGQKIEIRGFGGFKTISRRARRGRNPRTGERVDIPACITPSFKFSKEAQRTFEQNRNEILKRKQSLFRKKRRPRKITTSEAA